jgi:hypothetical protein
MQQVASFDITIGAGVTIDHKIRDTAEKLRARAVAFWNGLHELATSPDARWSGSKPGPLPGYYGSAFETASTGVPVTTFRGLV